MHIGVVNIRDEKKIIKVGLQIPFGMLRKRAITVLSGTPQIFSDEFSPFHEQKTHKFVKMSRHFFLACQENMPLLYGTPQMIPDEFSPISDCSC